MDGDEPAAARLAGGHAFGRNVRKRATFTSYVGIVEVPVRVSDDARHWMNESPR